jgi:hypothetical protein
VTSGARYEAAKERFQNDEADLTKPLLVLKLYHISLQINHRTNMFGKISTLFATVAAVTAAAQVHKSVCDFLRWPGKCGVCKANVIPKNKRTKWIVKLWGRLLVPTYSLACASRFAYLWLVPAYSFACASLFVCLCQLLRLRVQAWLHRHRSNHQSEIRSIVFLSLSNAAKPGYYLLPASS